MDRYGASDTKVKLRYCKKGDGVMRNVCEGVGGREREGRKGKETHALEGVGLGGGGGCLGGVGARV